jgi:hypothetical protein
MLTTYPKPMPPALKARTACLGPREFIWFIKFPKANELFCNARYTTERAAKKGLLRFAERHNLNLKITP